MILPLRRTLVRFVLLFSFFCTATKSSAQLLQQKNTYTLADTLRGSLNENRDWWDVLRYDITVKPNFEKKEIEGKVIIQAIATKRGKQLQIDLQQPLIIDSIVRKGNYFIKNGHSFPAIQEPFSFKQEGNIVLINLNDFKSIGERFDFHIFYHGKPIEARTPPWDGGWIWKKDKNGNPFVSVAVQGLGASAWYPCKDYQGDEPDNGASLTMIVPDTLVAIANGKLSELSNYSTKILSYKWEVKNPINNYCIVPYIGKYVNFTDTLMGEKGKLDINYWVLDYNVEKAKEQFKQVKPMLRAFEYWFGPYPFYEDSYKLIDAPHLGMEHQSAVAYGNQYKNGYLGMDRSASGWGKKWDFIIVHESGHEWFANNITTKDIADMWVHEAFTTYSETLFTEYYYGIQAGNEYNFGQRRNIRNDKPIIGAYGVNKEGSGDQYDKGSNMIHSIRHAINDDIKFRNILRDLNKKFYHQTVTTQEIESFISNKSHFNFSYVFNQYLRTTQIPTLAYYFSADNNKMYYRYIDCIEGFNLPIVFNIDNNSIKLQPSINWNFIDVTPTLQKFIAGKNIEKLYYINTKEITNP
jgi:aminopeptidase N